MGLGANNRPPPTRGARFELVALRWLECRGLRLISKNYRCRSGEIDLIMDDHGTLAFIEVRYRRSHHYGTAAESVDRNKQSRIIRAAQHFLNQHSTYAERLCRFDVVALSGSEERPHTEWIAGAFSA